MKAHSELDGLADTAPKEIADNAAAATPSRSRAARLRSVLVKTLLVLLLLLLILVAIVYWLTGTDSGFSRLSKLANEHVPGLSIDQASGNLARGVNAQGLVFKNDNLQVTASGLQTQWRAGCLLKKKFCLDQLHMDTLDINILATTDAPAAAARTEAIVLPDIDLPVALDIADVTIDSVQIQPPDNAPPQIIKDVHLTAKLERSAVAIDKLALSYQVSDEQTVHAELHGTAGLNGPYPLDIAFRLLSDDVIPDALPEGDGMQPVSIESRLSNTLSDLTINAGVSGIANVKLDARVQPLDPLLPATLTITSNALGWPVQSRSQILASDVRIDVSGNMDDYSFSMATALSGEQTPDTAIRLNGDANLERLILNDIAIDTLGGSVNGNAQLAMGEPMNWSTRWTINNINPSLHIPDLDGLLDGELSASGSIQQEQWSLKLEEAVLDGELRGLPFHLEGKLSKGFNNLWLIERIALNNDRNQIEAQGIVGDNLDIKADVNLPQLQNLLPGLAGGFDATLIMDGATNSPDITIDAFSDVIRFDDTLVRSLSINGDIDQLFADESKLDISVETVRVGENIISDPVLSLTGTRANHEVYLQAIGPDDTDVAMSLNGSLNDALDWSGILGQAQLSLPGHQLELKEPVDIAWQNDARNVNVSAHCWLVSTASSLCLDTAFASAEPGTTTLSLDQYALTQINRFLPESARVSGILDANVVLIRGDGGPENMQALVTATIDTASVQTTNALDEPVSFNYDSIVFNADLAPTSLNTSLSLNSDTLGNADIQVQMDPSDEQGRIEGTVALQGLLLNVAQPFLPDLETVEGTLGARGTLAGTLTAPEYYGTLTLDSPRLQADTLPLPITGGQLTATVNGQRMTMAGDLLSNEGVVAISGRGVLDPQKWNVDVSLSGNQLSIQRDPVQSAIVNHDIRIVANTRRLSVTGSVDIPEAVIDVADLPEGAATVSDDVVFVDELEDAPIEQAPAETSRSDLELAVLLDVNLGDDVQLSAYGLNAKLTGDMEVRLRGENPVQLGGEINVVDGIYKQYGQDLTANGQILFVGPVDSTRLNIDAVREISNEDRTAGLRIQGTAAEPEITLFTEPADKAEDAILSYVVLGRDINEASDQEADLLATAALALAVRGGRTVGSGVASKLGVEEFGLETRGSGDNTELVVSGRLNDRLLLRYGHGVFDAENTLYLRYDLTRKLYLEAAQSVQESVLDLFYSFSF